LIELAAIMESVHTVKGTELFNQKKNFREWKALEKKNKKNQKYPLKSHNPAI
jgi:hypothetical protein